MLTHGAEKNRTQVWSRFWWTCGHLKKFPNAPEADLQPLLVEDRRLKEIRDLRIPKVEKSLIEKKPIVKKKKEPTILSHSEALLRIMQGKQR